MDRITRKALSKP